jgi:small subunit ribosomal protein S17
MSEGKVARSAIGTVVSDKPQKTIIVNVEEKRRHPKYGKYVKHSNKIHAHMETPGCKMGDTVKIRESRAYSKTKRWEFVEVVTEA